MKLLVSTSAVGSSLREDEVESKRAKTKKMTIERFFWRPFVFVPNLSLHLSFQTGDNSPENSAFWNPLSSSLLSSNHQIETGNPSPAATTLEYPLPSSRSSSSVSILLPLLESRMSGPPPPPPPRPEGYSSDALFPSTFPLNAQDPGYGYQVSSIFVLRGSRGLERRRC
ncbi:hypothetical protein BDY24DRAFT_375536 [Mrakia frigida]|uniref:uncharacterized protein n=1 Tax=Mrakia frigida TaxID=29902 RepID=UPI003FCC1502